VTVIGVWSDFSTKSTMELASEGVKRGGLACGPAAMAVLLVAATNALASTTVLSATRARFNRRRIMSLLIFLRCVIAFLGGPVEGEISG
jgi:hypothetical protein